MSELQRRSLYQPQSVSQGFNPSKAADITPSLRANQQRMLQEMDAFAKAEMDDLKVQQEQEKMKLLAETKEAEQLMGFSSTLFDAVVGIRKQQIKNKEAEIRTLYFEDQEKIAEGKLLARSVDQQMSAIHDGDLKAADKSVEISAPYETTERLRNLNGWDQYYYRVLAAKSAGENYAAWMDEQRNSRTDTITVGGVEIAINDPKDSVEDAAVRAYLKKEYNALPEVAAVGLPLLAEHASDAWRKHDVKSAAAFQKNYAIDKSIEHRAEAFNLYSTTFKSNDKAFPQLFQTLRQTVDKDGKRLGNAGAWKVIRKYFKDQEDRGIDIFDELEAAKATPIPGDKKGRTYGDLYAKTQWNSLEDELGDERRTNFRNSQTDAKQKLHEYQQTVIDKLNAQEEPVTTAQLDDAIKGYDDLAARLNVYGEKPSALENYRGSATIEAVQLKEKQQRYEFLQERGMLDPSVILREPLEIQQRFLSVAQQQANERKIVSGPGDKAIKGYIAGKAEVSVMPDGSMKGITALVVADAQAIVNKRAREIFAINPDAGFQAAWDNAFVEWREGFDASVQSGTGKYAVVNGVWKEFLPKVQTVSNSLQRTDERIETISGLFEAIGTSALSSPGLFGDEQFFKQLEVGYGKPGWVMPPTIAWGARTLNVSPFQIINEQRKALGMTELPEYRNLIFNDNHPPEYRRFINDLVEGKATENQVFRYTETPAPVRQSLAQAIPENRIGRITRAFIGQESGGDQYAVNSLTEASGLGQLMKANIGPWTKQYLGREMSYSEFMNNKAAQITLLNRRFAEQYAKHSAPGRSEEEVVRRMAAVHYGGDGAVEHWNNPRYHDRNGPYNPGYEPNMAEYTASVWARISGQK